MDRRQNAGIISERRKHPRIQTQNDVSYILFNENQEITDQGKGKTLDLSQSGVLLETDKPLNGSFVMLITFDLNGKKIKVQGRVANTRKSVKSGYYQTGVEFEGSEKEQTQAIVAFVKVHHRRKQRDQNKNLHSVKQSV